MTESPFNFQYWKKLSLGVLGFVYNNLCNSFLQFFYIYNVIGTVIDIIDTSVWAAAICPITL